MSRRFLREDGWRCLDGRKHSSVAWNADNRYFNRTGRNAGFYRRCLLWIIFDCGFNIAANSPRVRFLRGENHLLEFWFAHQEWIPFLRNSIVALDRNPFWSVEGLLSRRVFVRVCVNWLCGPRGNATSPTGGRTTERAVLCATNADFADGKEGQDRGQVEGQHFAAQLNGAHELYTLSLKGRMLSLYFHIRDENIRLF